MALQRVPWSEALPRLASFSAIVDARSESEFSDDRLPGAVNWPTLNDHERHVIGTEYKQASPFDARKRGAAWAAANIARHLEREGPGLARDWKPLVYCWRGGQRSGALALVLSQIGFEVSVLEGGYRSFRRHVVETLEQLPLGLQFHVLCGTTGSGKSRLLEHLGQAGAQVLDLEHLARHRGSVLGGLDEPQPGQRAFETALWQALRGFDPTRPVWVEAESRTIGRLRVPDALILQMRAADCWSLEVPPPARVRFLIDEYRHFLDDPERLCQRLDALRELRGHAVIDAWQQDARSGRWEALVSQLLLAHYDPVYLKSMARNFERYGEATPVALPTLEPAALAAAARELVHGVPTARGPALRTSMDGA
jgi:tRNA 2-selenouridine synthase